MHVTVLNCATLQDDTKSKWKGSISLHDARIQIPSESLKGLKSTNCVEMEIHTAERVYRLGCKNDEERQSWMSKLIEAAKAAKMQLDGSTATPESLQTVETATAQEACVTDT